MEESKAPGETPSPGRWPPEDSEDSRVARLARLMQAVIQEDEDENIKSDAPRIRRKTTDPPLITSLTRKVLAPKATRLGDRGSVSRKGHGNRTEISYKSSPNALRSPVSAPPVSNFALSPPPIPLQNRAVHPFFLRELLRTGVCPVQQRSPTIVKDATTLFENRYAPQSNWTCADFVDFAIKPSTSDSHMSFIQALVCDSVTLPWVGRKEHGSEGRFNAKEIPGCPAGVSGRSIFGPATYFVSFSYEYRFDDLCHAILAHYESLPEALAASSQGQIAPIYYWLSIFGVNKNHGTDIRKNPDGDPTPAIIRSKAVLFACKPWHDPAALSRAWCLFELLTALDGGIEVIALNLDRDISLNEVFPEGSIKEAKEAFTRCLSTLDMQQAATSNKIDHGWLCSLMERNHPGGFSTLQPTLLNGLKPALMGALLTLVLKREVKDYDLAMKLVQGGGGGEDPPCMQWGSAFIGGPTQGGDAAASFFAIALGKSNNTVRIQELVLDPDVTPSHPSGSQGLLLTRPWNVLMSQEVPTWIPQVGGHGGKGMRPETSSAGVAHPHSDGGAVKTLQRDPSLQGHIPSLTPSPTNRSFDTPSPSYQISARSFAGKGGQGGGRGGVKSLDADWTLGGWVGSSQGTPSSKSKSPSAPPEQVPVQLESSKNQSIESDLIARKKYPELQAVPLTKKQAQEANEQAEALALMSRNEVTAQGAAQLSLALSMNPGGSLMTLSLSHNRSIEGQGAVTIFRSLRGNYSLKTLLMRDCGLDSSCCHELGKALRTNSSLTTLDLGQNPLLFLPPSSDAATAFSPKKTKAGFSSSPQNRGLLPCHHVAWGLPRSGLRDLRIDSTGLDSFQACILVKVLSSCPSLARLDLSNNHINGREAFDSAPNLMSDAVMMSQTEQDGEEEDEKLSLSPSMASHHRYRKESDDPTFATVPTPAAKNDCSSLFAQGIAGSLSLQCLLLGGNLIRSEGVVALSSALLATQNGAGRSLRMLVLRDNDLGLEVGLALLNLMKESSSFPLSSGPLFLSCLDLSCNPYISDVGIVELAAGLKASSSLIELRMEGVGMSAVGAAAIAEAIGKGAKAMRRLDISDNEVSNAGAEAFASALGSSSDSKLVELRLDRNGIRVEGRLALVSAIQANQSCALKHLGLVGNKDPLADPLSGAKLLPTNIAPTPAELVAASLKPLPSQPPDQWTGLTLPKKGGGDGSISSSRGELKVAAMSRSEQLLAQMLHVTRLLHKTRGLTIY